MSGGRLGQPRPEGDFSGIWTVAEVAARKLAGTWPERYSTAIQRYAPSALYMMEELSGTSMLDTSGNDNHGTYIGGALPSSPALLGDGELSLNATSSLYATAPGAVASATSGFSIVLDLQFSHTSNLIICERNQNAGYSLQTFEGAEAGKVGLVTGGGSPNIWLRSSIAINDGLPHCAVYVFGGTAASSYLYIDGVDRSTRPQTAGTPTYGATTAWYIGSRAGSFGFAGRLDGVAFIPSLLTPADAARISSAASLLVA